MIINKFGIGFHMDRIAFLMPPAPATSLTRRDALELAAWIVVLADPHFAVGPSDKDDSSEFTRIIREIVGE